MAISIEVYVGLLSAIVAAAIAMFSLLSSKISEKAKDLQAGESARNKFVAEALTSMTDSLSQSVSVVEKMVGKPNVELTAELRDKVDHLLVSIEEVSDVQDAMKIMVASLRGLRDSGVLLIFLTGFVSFIILAGGLSGNTYVVDVAIAVGITYFYALFVLGVRYLLVPYRKYNAIQRLLSEKNLYRIGG